MILVIDNYDSFTYNLVDLIEQFDEVVIHHPDETPLDLKIDGLVISPGPGHPDDTDELRKIIDAYSDKPILGICLGAQALTTYYGGKVIAGKEVKHGKVDQINLLEQSVLYKECNQNFNIMRYHSLISDESTFPKCLKVTGRTIDAIQSFEHITRPHFGIQYHPESFASEYGNEIIKAFVNTTKEGANNGYAQTTYSIS
ncbi:MULTISPECIES: aminodeoxychorismate/anthranilate synthase component II [Mammaliicoccus]|uniref:anthranilate synthase component II n=1 Tax=Mammaliicoccus TaxID=2803850 RepID=UPI001EFB8D2D|nr:MULTISPECIES: aminodeoxychorismate/anthranilate synthase component II [Mammaliicoccus]MEB6200644.1 aminodeoxychorismate/anthranilate synthase component II [Mammaliicoccus fleurettii]